MPRKIEVVVEASDRHSGLAKIGLELDGRPLETREPTDPLRWQVNLDREGDHQLVAHAIDKADNRGETQLSFSVRLEDTATSGDEAHDTDEDEDASGDAASTTDPADPQQGTGNSAETDSDGSGDTGPSNSTGHDPQTSDDPVTEGCGLGRSSMGLGAWLRLMY